MSTDHSSAAGDSQGHKLLAQLDGVELHGVGKGRLSLTDERLEFSIRRWFLSSHHPEFSVPLTAISSATVRDASSVLVVESTDDSEGQAVSRLYLPKGESAAGLCRSLTESLGMLSRELQRQQERDLYQAFLWRSAHRVWIAVGLLSGIVRGLVLRDWDAVDALVNETTEAAEALAKEGLVNIDCEARSLAQIACSRDSTSTLLKTVGCLESIGTSLNNRRQPAEWGETVTSACSSGLVWQDIRYVFFFAIRYGLLSLWRDLGETDKITESQPRLAKLLNILAERVINEPLAPHLLVEDDASGIACAMESMAENLETLLRKNAGAI